MCKDIECAFGILKGHFAILRYGIIFQSITKSYQVWLSCYALHNLLLYMYELNQDWDSGVPSSNW